MKTFKYLFVFLLTLTLLVACKKKKEAILEETNTKETVAEEAVIEEAVEEETLIEENIPSLKDVFKDEFYIGAAIEPEQLTCPETVTGKAFFQHYSRKCNEA